MYIGMLMLIIFYLYGILGIKLFRDNDPWHFETIPTALLTLFRCASLEDWTDVMYINWFGCDVYGYTGEALFNKYTCITPESWGFISVIYFVSFVIIASLVMISLFVGIVCTSMNTAQE